MRNNNFSVRMVYHVDGQVFNVDGNGSKKRFDPIFKRYFGYASADNVKHCIAEKFSELSGKERPKRYFGKAIKKGDDNQGSIFTEFSLKDHFLRLFGVWNANDKSFKDEKYKKCALKSIVNIADFTPLHTLLSSMSKTTGVCCGNANDVVFAQDDKDGAYFDAEAFAQAKKVSVEDAEKWFDNARPLNFLEKNETSDGIYKQDINFNINDFKYVNINEITLTEEDIERYKAEGYDFTTILGKKYLVVPTEEAIELFNDFVDAIFSWDFMSNNSTHGSLKKRLRTSFAINNPDVWECATMATVKNIDGKDVAEFELMSKENEEKYGVYSFNSPTLKAYYNSDSIEYNVLASEHAKEKMKEIGAAILSNI